MNELLAKTVSFMISRAWCPKQSKQWGGGVSPWSAYFSSLPRLLSNTMIAILRSGAEEISRPNDCTFGGFRWERLRAIILDLAPHVWLFVVFAVQRTKLTEVSSGVDCESAIWVLVKAFPRKRCAFEEIGEINFLFSDTQFFLEVSV